MNHSLLARMLGVLITTGSLLAFFACSSPASGEACANNGQQCACSDSCSRTCETQSSAGCQFTCAAGKTCTFDCAGGNCSVDCASGATCSVSCAGGGCNVTAEKDATLDVTCGNKGSCTLGCTGTKKCNVDGAPAQSASIPAGSSGSSGSSGVPGLPGAGE